MTIAERAQEFYNNFFNKLVFRLISCQAACRLGSHDSRQKRLVRLPTLLRKKLV
jgi:hypothetical protein